MFNRKDEKRQPKTWVSNAQFPFFGVESLEDRRLLSGSLGHGHGSSTLEFSQLPSAVQAGLDALATTDGLTAPASTSTQTVYLKNSNGVESYTIDITSTGTDTQLTVDQNGNPVTKPTKSTTTFGAITNTAVTAEITAIASALSLTAPTSTTTVNVSTAANGTATYTLALTPSTSTTTTTTSRHRARSTQISVDSNGNPVGNQSLPFSVLPTAIQSGLNAHVPSGATALASTSTQTVTVRTLNGVTSYSVTFASTGTTTTISVNSVGALIDLPSTSTVDFDTLPSAAQTELQTLATADGVTTTIAGTQTVSAYNEGNGTTIYTVTLPTTSSSGSTYNISISVDENGNPTVLPSNGGGGGGGSCGEFGGSGFAGLVSTGSSRSSSDLSGFGGDFGFFGRHRF